MLGRPVAFAIGTSPSLVWNTPVRVLPSGFIPFFHTSIPVTRSRNRLGLRAGRRPDREEREEGRRRVWSLPEQFDS